jgi:hypothetical protein
MSFVRFSVSACRVVGVFFATLASVALAAGPSQAADSGNVAPHPFPKAMAGAPSGAELVGKLLSERTGASDPDIPLPQRDLAVGGPGYVPLTGPRIYGRRDEGSLIVGLKIPIPADRGAFQQSVRHGGGGGVDDASGGTR